MAFPFDMINSFLHPEKAYENAGKAEQGGWNEAKGYEQPYWQGGRDQYGRLNDATGKLMNPAELQNEWSKGYETSPYAQQLLKQNQASGLDAASSMGLNGSSAALGNIQQGAGQIVQQDRQQYMNDLMQKYLAGIGLGTSMYNTGAQAGSNLGRGAMQHGENQAQLEYGRTAAPGKLFENLARTGIGFAAGGPIGAAAAQGINIPGMGGGGGRSGGYNGGFQYPSYMYNQ